MEIKSINNSCKQNFGIYIGNTVRGFISTARNRALAVGDELVLKNIDYIKNARNDLRLTAILEGGNNFPEKYAFYVCPKGYNNSQKKPLIHINAKESAMNIINILADAISKLSK